jgi:hypothetical protein
MRNYISFLFFILSAFPVLAQDHHSNKRQEQAGGLYVNFGAHRVFFTKSDIHFRDHETADYDFTILKARAKDDNSFNLGKGIDAPQYSMRIGYYFRNRPDIGFEIAYDHAKYIMVQNQKAHIRGEVNGVEFDKDSVIGKDFVEYEHTDGANYLMVNFLKRKNLLASADQKHLFSVVIKPGIGIVIPRTYSRIMYNKRNDRYHVSGYVAGVEGALRYDLRRIVFAEAAVKTVFANYNDVTLYGAGKASQKWGSLQVIFSIGYQFR